MSDTVKTTSAYMWTRILTAPFWAIYNMLPFILYKDLGASPLQLALIITLKPLVSIFSIYWSAAIAKRPDLLVRNIIWAGIIGHLPFLFCPIMHTPWFYIASFGFYMMLARGVVPAWMEILKRNLSNSSHKTVFAYGSIVSYLGNGIFPLALGWFLDGYQDAWRWIFPIAASLSFIAIIFQLRIPITYPSERKKITEENHFLKPWIDARRILGFRPDFRCFQIGFMLGGMGLMVMQPALPLFFVDTLQLSYTEMAIALALCKGVGFAMTTPLWAKWMNKIDIYRFSSYITILAALFPLLLYTAQMHIYWLYIGYIAYGVMQAGSELSWHLSGPIFAREEDSIVYSNINTLSVGLRGAFMPALGSLLCCCIHTEFVMLLGGLLCLLATERMLAFSRRYSYESDAIA